MQLDSEDRYKYVGAALKAQLEIDKLLEAMLMLNAYLGLDSTYAEKQEAKHKQNEMLKRIKEIDPDFFKVINLDEFPHLKKMIL